MRILHVLDATCDPTVLQVAGTLRSRLTGGDIQHHVAVCDGPTVPVARRFISGEVHRAEARFSPWAAFSPGLKAIGSKLSFDLINAWGPRAASLGAAMLPGRPLLATLLDPTLADETGRRLRSMPNIGIVAGSQVIRRRLAERGIAPERIVVVRGPVDFGAINQARDAGLRAVLAGKNSPVVLMSGPPSKAGDQFTGLWAAAIVSKVIPAMRVILPYDSPERTRLAGFLNDVAMPELLIQPPPDWSWAKLVACADAFLISPSTDICVEPIAWAMAAGVPILGSAVRSVAEILADRSNALLCKPGEPRTLASKLLLILEDTSLRRQLSEVARGQAYEVFSVRQFVENHRQVYENVLQSRPVGDQVRDTAMVG